MTAPITIEGRDNLDRFRIHKEGYSIIGMVLLASVGMFAVTQHYFPAPIPAWVAIFLGITDVLLIAFFRNPHRPAHACDSAVISPASGTIVAVEHVDDAEYISQPCMKISIFLSVFNVHVNVLPVSGEIVYANYHAGKYLAAFHPKASVLNERSVTAIQTPSGHTLLVRQIAGFVARRISTYVHQGDVVRCGNELGFIKFGSRVEVCLPLTSQINVRVGDRVKVGVTTLAVLA